VSFSGIGRSIDFVGTASGLVDNITFGSATATGTATVDVPAPAAIWLFGSGLISLIGVRKKY